MLAIKDEAIHKALKVLNCLNNDRVYETAWVKGAINACEEALKQDDNLLTIAYMSGMAERKSKALEQPAQGSELAWYVKGWDDAKRDSRVEQLEQEVECSNHPNAPHGFCRDASHSAGRYVCECEVWQVEQPAQVTRLEVIDNNGRSYVNYGVNKLQFSYQDDGRTLKLFTNGAGIEQPAWQGLTDDEITNIGISCQSLHQVARAIEQALKDKNT